MYAVRTRYGSMRGEMTKVWVCVGGRDDGESGGSGGVRLWTASSLSVEKK